MSRYDMHDGGDLTTCMEHLEANGIIVIDPASESELHAGIEEAQKCLTALLALSK